VTTTTPENNAGTLAATAYNMTGFMLAAKYIPGISSNSSAATTTTTI
jgi:hypothetical protein